MKKYNSIKSLLDAVKSGEVEESKIVVVLDNDTTDVSLRRGDGSTTIFTGNGDYDIEDLWCILLPTAVIEFC